MDPLGSAPVRTQIILAPVPCARITISGSDPKKQSRTDPLSCAQGHRHNNLAFVLSHVKTLRYLNPIFKNKVSSFDSKGLVIITVVILG